MNAIRTMSLRREVAKQLWQMMEDKEKVKFLQVLVSFPENLLPREDKGKGKSKASASERNNPSSGSGSHGKRKTEGERPSSSKKARAPRDQEEEDEKPDWSRGAKDYFTTPTTPPKEEVKTEAQVSTSSSARYSKSKAQISSSSAYTWMKPTPKRTESVPGRTKRMLESSLRKK